jgi:quercetin dioxygenase-like cupin family protein
MASPEASFTTIVFLATRALVPDHGERNTWSRLLVEAPDSSRHLFCGGLISWEEGAPRGRKEGTTMKPKRLRATGVVAALLVTLAAGVALATPGVGVVSEVLARGTVDDSVKIRTFHPSDFVVQRLTIDPGGTTGWHTHPGPTIVTVTEGTLVLTHADCQSRTFGAGSGFFQPANEVHVATNPSAHERTVVWASYVLPVGAPIRVDADNPGCP